MLQHATIHKILYINLAFMGDLLLATPALRVLRQRYPKAQLDVLVTPWAAQVAADNPYIDGLRIYDKRGKHKQLKALWQLLRELRQERYDLAISANFAIRGALVAKAINARYRVGYDIRHAGWFLTHPVSAVRPAIRHETENQLAVLTPLGITTDNYDLSLTIRPAAAEKVRQQYPVQVGRPQIVICPHGRHPLNSWTDEGYTALLRALASQYDCFLVGGPAEKERLMALQAKAGGAGKVLAGELTIPELAALLAQCRLVISVDTGPLHIAGAVGTPVLGLFSRSDPRVWGPRRPHDRIIKPDMPCAPCIMPRECKHHSCMQHLRSETVIQLAREMLQTNPGEEDKINE